MRAFFSRRRRGKAEQEFIVVGKDVELFVGVKVAFKGEGGRGSPFGRGEEGQEARMTGDLLDLTAALFIKTLEGFVKSLLGLRKGIAAEDLTGILEALRQLRVKKEGKESRKKEAKPNLEESHGEPREKTGKGGRVGQREEEDPRQATTKRGDISNLF